MFFNNASAVFIKLRINKYYIHRLLLPDGVAFGENKNANQEIDHRDKAQEVRERPFAYETRV